MVNWYSLGTIGCVFRSCWRHERLDFPLNISLCNNLISPLFWTSNGFNFMDLCTYVSKVRIYQPPYPEFEYMTSHFLPICQYFYWFWPTVRKKCSEDRFFFETSGLRPRISKNFEISRTICSNSEMSEQFLAT